MAINRPTMKTGPGCLVLVALPFAAVGVGMSAWLFCGIAANGRMQSWRETPAKIVRAKLEAHSDPEGSTTYEATAEYTYQFGDRPYTGNRVSVQGGSDNFGSFQKDVYRQLSEHQRSGDPFRCYVNPAKPSEAVLFRDLRWEMIGVQTLFATAFGSAGFAILTFGVWGCITTRGNRALAALHPDEPWLWKKDWADGKINASSKPSAAILLVIALFWNLASAPAWLVFPHNALDKGNRLALLLLPFPTVGLILILCALVSVMRRRKYGRSVFEMAAVPGVIGGQLAGVVRVPAKVRPEEGFRLSLDCIQMMAGDNPGTVVWQNEQFIAHELSQSDPEQSAIPVLFQIPYECRPTDETEPYHLTIWRLRVSAKTPGLDYSTSFDVPVFKTSESDPNFKADPSLIAQYVAADDPDRVFRDAGLVKRRSPSGEGFRLVFPMMRTPGMGIIVVLAGCMFGGVPIAMYYLPVPSWVAWLFGIAFGFAGLLFLINSLDLWFYRSVVDVSPAGLTVVGGLFGFGREKRINATDIEELAPVGRMSSGAKTWYDIQVVCRPKGKVTVGKRVLGRFTAESVIREIEQAMGK